MTKGKIRSGLKRKSWSSSDIQKQFMAEVNTFDSSDLQTIGLAQSQHFDAKSHSAVRAQTAI